MISIRKYYYHNLRYRRLRRYCVRRVRVQLNSEQVRRKKKKIIYKVVRVDFRTMF